MNPFQEQTQEQRSENRSRTIRSWPESERPRERLAAHGAETLSTAELVAILLGSGSRSRSAVDLAREIVAEPLAALSLHALKRIKGVGGAKAARILAAVELGRRAAAGETAAPARIRESADAVALMRPRLSGLTREIFYLLALDVKNRPLAVQEISRGDGEAVVFYPRDVFREAVRAGASAVICVHNHPSGDPTPSREDRELTERLKGGAALLGLRFLDHIIIAGDSSFSFAENG